MPNTPKIFEIHAILKQAVKPDGEPYFSGDINYILGELNKLALGLFTIEALQVDEIRERTPKTHDEAHCREIYEAGVAAGAEAMLKKASAAVNG